MTLLAGSDYDRDSEEVDSPVFMISKPPGGRPVILGFFGLVRRPIGRVSRGAVPFRMTTQRAIPCIRSNARRSSLRWRVFRAHLPQTFHGFEAIYRALIFKSVL